MLIGEFLGYDHAAKCIKVIFRAVSKLPGKPLMDGESAIGRPRYVRIDLPCLEVCQSDLRTLAHKLKVYPLNGRENLRNPMRITAKGNGHPFAIKVFDRFNR